MVCLRNISVDTLHIGDTEDDDDNNALTPRKFVRVSCIVKEFLVRCGTLMFIAAFTKTPHWSLRSNYTNPGHTLPDSITLFDLCWL
jgi:hypothetical protein